MIRSLLEQIDALYPLTPVDTGEWHHLNVNGMKFEILAWKAAGLGHVSVMTATGMLGLMKMDTLIINPTEKDLPLYSYDRIHALGNDTLIIELYDTLLTPCSARPLAAVQSRYSKLPERDPGAHWYDSIKLPESVSKKGKKAHTPALNRMTADYTAAYLRLEADAVSDPTAKRTAAAVYVDGLLEHGGPSTDVFKKALGAEKTAALFRTILFATAPDDPC